MDELVVNPEDQEWEKINVSGVALKTLYKNEETGASIALAKFAKGAGMPSVHKHASNQFMFVLKGKFSYPGTVLTEGMFYMNPKDHLHGPSQALEDTILLEIYDGPHYYPNDRPY
jgi:2,4'-dihydroxyacetophenone dioxygenase